MNRFYEWIADGNWPYMYGLTVILATTGAAHAYSIWRRRKTGDRSYRLTDDFGMLCIILAKAVIILTIYGQVFNTHR